MLPPACTAHIADWVEDEVKNLIAVMGALQSPDTATERYVPVPKRMLPGLQNYGACSHHRGIEHPVNQGNGQ